MQTLLAHPQIQSLHRREFLDASGGHHLLGTPLAISNHYHRRKKGKVAFLEFDCDHFEGQHGRTLEASGFYPGGRVRYGMDLVFDGGSRAPHPDPHQKTAPRGGD